MIVRLLLNNFKAIREETRIDLSSLTVFCGANSSGKSTALQSLLLLAQTARSDFSERFLELNGKLFRFGDLSDIRRASVNDGALTIGCSCFPLSSPRPMFSLGKEEPLGTITFHSTFVQGDADVPNPLLYPRLVQAIVLVQSRDVQKQELIATDFGGHISKPDQLKITEKLGLEGWLIKSYPELFRYKVQVQGESWSQTLKDEDVIQVIGCDFKHFIPQRALVAYDERSELSRYIYDLLTRAARGEDLQTKLGIPDSAWGWFQAKLGHRFPNLFNEKPESIASLARQIASLPKEDTAHIRRRIRLFEEELIAAIFESLPEQVPDIKPIGLPDMLSNGVHYLQETLASKVRYLGPLRDEPRSRYPVMPFDGIDLVGLRGELTAAVLHRHLHDKISYLPPQWIEGATAEQATLEEAVKNWLSYMGLAVAFKTEDSGKFGHSMKFQLSESDEYFDLTHVGFGLSQVVPVLVLGLLAHHDDTLLFEQPELHCHPKVQSRLADFFLSLSVLGKQCIVETHSEYLIRRLRTRIAQHSEDTLQKLVKLYFVSRDGDASRFQPIEFNEYGSPIQWPPGFFDESDLENQQLLSAAVQKKRNRTKQES